MKLSAILLSKVIAFIDTVEMLPTGGLYAPDFVRDVALQFEFQKFPQTLEEFNVQKGMDFLTGRVGKGVIGKLSIWPNILVIEARHNTAECQDMLNEILHWAAMKFNLKFDSDMIARYAFVSDISFTSDVPLLTFDPLLQKIANQVSASVSETWKEAIRYEQFDFKIGHDPLSRKWGIAPFQIARLVEHRFTENHYFSEAPVPTDLHIKLIEEYEKGISERLR